MEIESVSNKGNLSFVIKCMIILMYVLSFCCVGHFVIVRIERMQIPYKMPYGAVVVLIVW